jgi:proteasome lid subunit RPN8/RPN11
MVVVDGSALFDVNKTAFERGEIVAGQVHTHPSAAYHSELDDTYPLATLLGSLSVVIPDFARHAPRDIDAWAWYRLVGTGSWEPINEDTEIVVE